MTNKSIEHTGGSSSYYTVEVKQPVTEGRKPYVAECLDIAEALELTIAEFNIFKAIWRTAAERQGKSKKGNHAKYDAEKIVFFAQRMLAKHTNEETNLIGAAKTVDANDVLGRNEQKRGMLENSDGEDENVDLEWFGNNPLLPEHLELDNLTEILNYLPKGYYPHHPEGEQATVNFLQTEFSSAPVKLAKALANAGFVWNSTGEALLLRHHTNIINPSLEEEEKSEHRRARCRRVLSEAFRKLT